MSTIDPRAIFFGVALDQTLTLVLPWLLPRPELRALLVAGTAATALGGYVAGRAALLAPVRHGLLVGAVALVIGIFSRVDGAAELPRWYVVGAFAALLPAGAVGGLVARRKTV